MSALNLTQDSQVQTQGSLDFDSEALNVQNNMLTPPVFTVTPRVHTGLHQHVLHTHTHTHTHIPLAWIQQQEQALRTDQVCEVRGENNKLK